MRQWPAVNQHPLAVTVGAASSAGGDWPARTGLRADWWRGRTRKYSNGARERAGPRGTSVPESVRDRGCDRAAPELEKRSGLSPSCTEERVGNEPLLNQRTSGTEIEISHRRCIGEPQAPPFAIGEPR